MDSQFWINAWNEGRTGFHQADINDKLLQYFPQLRPKENQKVLVPLCGKTKDLLWLRDQNLDVHGVELHEDAVKAFFIENQLSNVKVENNHHFTSYTSEGVRISTGDFFKLDAESNYDFVYDRASLVALPFSMRKSYSEVINRSLKKGGKCLLIVYEYDQTKMDGPPFSIDDAEILRLYEEAFTIEHLESQRPLKEGPRLMTLDESLKQKVYVLEKK